MLITVGAKAYVFLYDTLLMICFSHDLPKLKKKDDCCKTVNRKQMFTFRHKPGGVRNKQANVLNLEQKLLTV